MINSVNNQPKLLNINFGFSTVKPGYKSGFTANQPGCDKVSISFKANFNSEAIRELKDKIEEFGVVEEGQLYRGSCPSPDCVDLLAKAGIKTIVNVLESSIEDEVSMGSGDKDCKNYLDKIQKNNLNYYEITSDMPTKRDIDKFLRITKAEGPVYIHCGNGWTRTGIFVALFRMFGQGKSINQAVKESNNYGPLSPDKVGKDRMMRRTSNNFELGMMIRLKDIISDYFGSY